MPRSSSPCRGIRFRDRFISFRRFRFAFKNKPCDGSKVQPIATGDRDFANINPRSQMLVDAFQTRGCVHRIAETDVVEISLTAKIPNHRIAGINADPGDAKRHALFVGAFAEPLCVSINGQRTFNRAGRVVALSQRGAKYRDHGIANDLINGAVMIQDNPRDVGKLFIQQAGQQFGLGHLRQGRKIRDIGENVGHLPNLATKFQLARVFLQFLKQGG